MTGCTLGPKCLQWEMKTAVCAAVESLVASRLTQSEEATVSDALTVTMVTGDRMRNI